jgi:AICAR transformylase/IMP cyclohydrolase PurH
MPTPAAWPSARTLVEAYDKAWKTDPTSAFGGILAFNRPVDEATARAHQRHKQFVEVLIAPGFDAGARALFAAKQNLRVLECRWVRRPMRWTSSASAAACCCRRPT